MEFSEKNPDAFKNMFNSDNQQIDNYVHNLFQNIAENIMETSLFQTELVFRLYYSKITSKSISDATIPKILVELFDDTENKWSKDESNLIMLLWALRNTIHTGGIYFKNGKGLTLIYKKQEYSFEFGKAPKFLKNNNLIINLLSDLLDSLNALFSSDKIKNVGHFKHPNYYALDK